MTKDSSQWKKEIPLPELGEGGVSGELAKWLVKKGDYVCIDQVLAEIMTDKAIMEVSSPYEGRVEKLLISEGANVEVGRSLLILNTSESLDQATTYKSEKQTLPASPPLSETLTENSTTKKSGSASPHQSSSSDLKGDSFEESSPRNQGEVLATPLTRRLAQKLGIDLRTIKGSGLAGRITKEDLERHSSRKIQKNEILSSLSSSGKDHSLSELKGPSIPKEDGQERIPLKGIRKKIAEKMQLSHTVIPHFTLLESANMEQVENMKSSVKKILEEKNIKVTYLSFVMKALLKVVKTFPELNASIDDHTQEIVIKKYYHFGFAADTPRGLLVPVIKNIDTKSLTEISVNIQELAVKAREGSLSLEEMSGGTITLTNIGSLGGEYATPIINAPETTILGMYRLFIKPHWDGSSFRPQKTMNFSLTCDHRLIDGAVSAKALKNFVQAIENPLGLFI